MGGGGGGKGGESMFGGGGTGDMNSPFGTMNLGQWIGLTKSNPPQGPVQAYGDILETMRRYMPAYGNTIRKEIPKFEKTAADTNTKFAPQYAETQKRLQRIIQEGERGRIRSVGGDVVRDVNSLSNEVNPEYAANKGVISDRVNQLMQPGLTGGEIEAIRRGLRTDSVNRGTENVESNMNTIANATTFGNAARDRMERGVQTAAAINPTLQSMTPDSIFGIASGRGISGPDKVGDRGIGVAEGLGQGSLQTKLAEMGITSQQEMNYHGGLGKLVGSVCGCYIFRAHYGVEIPWWIVFARDYFHAQDPMLGHGYKRMAKWLVPLMKRWTIVRKIVEYTMIRPLTLYGGYMYNVVGYEGGYIFKPVINFWFKIWRRG